MNKVTQITGLCLCLLCFPGMGMAVPTDTLQQPQKELREIPNPEKAARKLTDEWQKALQLTKKQYKKIYKLNLKEQKELLKNSLQFPPMGGFGMREGQHPHHADMPPAGGRPDGPAEFGNRRPPMMNRQSPEELQKRAEKKNKKMKKILTGEQYEKWLSISRKPGPARQPAPKSK